MYEPEPLPSTESFRPADALQQRLEVAGGRVSEATGADRADQLRRAAEFLGYRAVTDHVTQLRRVEMALVAAALPDWARLGTLEQPLDIIRRHLLRGMAKRHLELGEHVAFWVRR